MRSIKKPALVAFLTALAVMAVPAVSSASEMTFANGQRVPVGTVIASYGTNITFFNSTLGPRVCPTFNFNQEVVRNDGTQLEMATPSNPGLVTAGCKNGSNEISFENFVWRIKFADTSANAVKSGVMSTSFKEHVGTKLVCLWTGQNIRANYQARRNRLEFNESPGLQSSGCGTDSLGGKFELKVALGGAAVIIV